jgi:hypothetical protein
MPDGGNGAPHGSSIRSPVQVAPIMRVTRAP